MVRSLAVIGAFVAAVYLLVPRPDITVIPSGDIQAASEQASAAADVPVLVPDVPSEWKVTSARREPAKDGLPATWHVGYLTADKEYIGLKATSAASEAWLRSVTVGGVDVADPVEVGGVEWATWVSPDNGRVSLVRGDVGGEAVVVTGTAPRDDLVSVAAAAQQ